MTIKKIAIISPYAGSICSFRGDLIKKLVDRRINVTVLAPDYNNEIRADVRALGAETKNYTLNRIGLNPINEIWAIYSIYRILVEIEPDAVLGYTHKPVIYGLIAARLAKIPLRYGLLEGLGFAFTPSKEFRFKRSLLRFILCSCYRIVLQNAKKVFFLNRDDLADFQHLRIIRFDQGVVLGGIGVNLTEWMPLPQKTQPIVFTLAARLLKEKGVVEYAKAARWVKRKYHNVRFILLGALDSNPGAISKSMLLSWVNEGIIEWPGYINDVKPYLAETSVFVLPSYYREGVPRSIQEAMALARPIITTDLPGCKETVIDGINGFLVAACNVEALAHAMECFIIEPKLIERMGKESRRLAEERFNADMIDNKFIAEMVGAAQ